jgi:hypothetical protein
MQTVVGMAFLVVGVGLIMFGMHAAASVSSRFSELFAGTPSDRTIWLVVAGVAAAMVGLGRLLAGRRRTLSWHAHQAAPARVHHVHSRQRKQCVADVLFGTHQGLCVSSMRATIAPAQRPSLRLSG